MHVLLLHGVEDGSRVNIEIVWLVSRLPNNWHIERNPWRWRWVQREHEGWNHLFQDGRILPQELSRIIHWRRIIWWKNSVPYSGTKAFTLDNGPPFSHKNRWIGSPPHQCCSPSIALIGWSWTLKFSLEGQNRIGRTFHFVGLDDWPGSGYSASSSWPTRYYQALMFCAKCKMQTLCTRWFHDSWSLGEF